MGIMQADNHAHIESKLDYFIGSKKIPNIIFHGPSGSGKRTIIDGFLYKIYEGDRDKMKKHIMTVECSHGKGIKFIREDLKFFAKSHIQSNQGANFKSIVLLNADSLTIDAQSALRRCIELFSYNTRFFIVVENKHKLLNPILSRFCEIYVPEFLDSSTGKTQNLHQYHLAKKYGDPVSFDEWFDSRIIEKNMDDDLAKMNLASEAYESGLSCIDFVKWVLSKPHLSDVQKANFAMHFEKIKSEYRCEKMLFLCLLCETQVSKI